MNASNLEQKVSYIESLFYLKEPLSEEVLRARIAKALIEIHTQGKTIGKNQVKNSLKKLVANI